MRAQAVEVDLGRDRRAPAARGEAGAVALARRRDDLRDPRQDEDLGLAPALDDPHGEPERVADDDARLDEALAPAPGEPRVDHDVRRPAARPDRRRRGQQRVLDQPRGQRERSRADADVDADGVVLEHPPCADGARDLEAARAEVHPGDRPTARMTNAAAGT